MKIVIKLILGFLAATLIIVVVGVVLVTSFDKDIRNDNAYTNAVAPLSAVLELSDVVGVRGSVAGNLVNKAMKINIKSQEVKDQIAGIRAREVIAIETIEKTSTTDREKYVLEEYKKTRADFFYAFDKELEALEKGNYDAAQSIYVNEVFPLSKIYSGYVSKIGNLKIELARNTFADNFADNKKHANKIIIAMGVIILLIMFWIFLSGCVAVGAKNMGRSGLGFFLFSLFVSPILAVVILLIIGKNKDVIEKENIEIGINKKCPYCANMTA